MRCLRLLPFVFFALMVLVVTSAMAQIPTLDVQFSEGFGCTEINYSAGGNLYGSTSCDNPAAAIIGCGKDGCNLGYYAWHDNPEQVGSYFINDSLGRNADHSYFWGLPGETFSGPIYPMSSAGTWFVGGYDLIYHNGVYISTGLPEILWSRIISNPRGDAFVLGNGPHGQVLAKFSAAGKLVFIRSLNFLGFGVADIARDPSGNLYLAGQGPAGWGRIAKLNPTATKLIWGRALDQLLPMRIFADAYQVAVVGDATLPTYTVNAPQPTIGGGKDGFIASFSTAGYPFYSTFIGGAADEDITGGGINADSSVSISGTTKSGDWITGGDLYRPAFYAEVGPFKKIGMPANTTFGYVTVGTTKVVNMVLKNIGNAPVHITSPRVPAPFTLASGSCSTILPAKSCTYKLAWTPTAKGAISGLFIATSDANPVQIWITGKGI